MRFIIIFSVFFLFFSCVSKEREKELLSKISDLESQLDECENGAEKLIAKVEKAYVEKNYLEARKNIEALNERHPESPKNEEFKSLLRKIEKEEIIENKRKEAEEKERIRIANLNNTGIWEVGYYVDDFGDPTQQSYIRNSNFIKGFFSILLLKILL